MYRSPIYKIYPGFECCKFWGSVMNKKLSGGPFNLDIFNCDKPHTTNSSYDREEGKRVILSGNLYPNQWVQTYRYIAGNGLNKDWKSWLTMLINQIECG